MGTSAFLIGCALAATTANAAYAAPAATRSRRPPRAPAIAQGRYTFAAFAGRPAPIKLEWPPVSDASRFRARWTDAGAHVDIELPGTATGFEHAAAAPGHHDLSVVAIDARGMESEPAEVAIDVVAILAIPPGGDTPSPGIGPAFAVGSRFSSPGLSCRLGSEPATDEAIASFLGATTLTCGGQPGQPRIDVPLVIAPVVIDAPAQPIERTTPTTLHITVASVAPLGPRLAVDAIGAVSLGRVERTPSGLDAVVIAHAGAAAAGLAIRADGFELGRIELALAAPPVPRLDWFALDIGGQIGLLALPTSNALGAPRDPADTLTTGAMFGGHIGLFPIRRAGIETETSLAFPGYRGRAGQSVILSARGQLVVQTLPDGRYSLGVVGGAGLLGVLAGGETSKRTVSGAIHWGAAFTVEIRPVLSLRIEALHVITSAQDGGYANGLEIQIGAITRLGRSDRSW